MAIITDLDGSLQPRLLLGCEAGQREIVDHPQTLEAAEGAARGLQAGPDLCSDFFNFALHCILLFRDNSGGVSTCFNSFTTAKKSTFSDFYI